MIFIFNNQGSNGIVFHYFKCLSGKNFTLYGFRVRGHHIGHGDIVNIHLGVNNAAQISVGEHAEQFILISYHGGHAKAFFGHYQQRLMEWLGGQNSRHFTVFMHDVRCSQ